MSDRLSHDLVREFVRSFEARERDAFLALSPDAAVASFTYGLPPEVRRRTLVLRLRDGVWRIVHLHGSNLNA